MLRIISPLLVFPVCDFAALVLIRCCKLLRIVLGAYLGPVSAFSVRSTAVCDYCISCISHKPKQSYDVTSIFQDGGRDIAISLPISVLVTSGRKLLAYQISMTFLYSWLIYYCFRFLKTNVPMLNFYFRLRFSRLRYHRHVILHLLCQISSKSDQPRHHIHFSRWRPRHRNSTSGFRFRITSLI